MIYTFLKTICKLALKVYYRKTHVQGLCNIPKEGPFIIVANHPNSFLDPLCIATQTKPKISFLAKGVLFKKKMIARVLKGLNMLPIHRAEDNPKMLSKNTAVFEDCFKKLGQKGVIMIFPEGTSEMERRLRKIKTGAARIALGAEKQFDFTLGVKILPVGLNYTNSSRFRSEVFIYFGKPISVKDYKDKYFENEMSTAKDLTQTIESSIKELMVTIDNYEHDEITEKVEAIYQNTLIDNPTDIIKSSQAIVDAVNFYQQNYPNTYDDMAAKIDEYYLKINQLNLSNKSIESIENRKSWLPNLLKSGFALILGFPLWLLGIIASYIPYKLPRIVALKISDSEAFYGALLMSLGTLFFIIFYLVEIALFGYFTKHLLLTVLFGAFLIVSSFFAIYYARNARRLFFNLKLMIKLFRKKELVKEVSIERKKIIYELDELRITYLNKKD